jgi:alpha-L-fucosidase
VNGEAIYGTHNWVKFSDGGGRGSPNIRFTVKGDALYAIIIGNWPGAETTIASLGESAGKVATVTMLGSDGNLEFTQDATGLKVKLPAAAPCKYAYVLKITGLKMNPPTWTASGNPQLQAGVNGN